MKRDITAPSIGGTYSGTTAHGTVARGFVFVTGQVANEPGGDPGWNDEQSQDWGSIEAQTVRVMENVKAILEEAGSSMEHVVKRNVYLTHVGDFERSYEVMERYFPTKVASTGVLTGLVPTGARIEVEVIAVVPD